jgi:BirA family transcriptional regulator, biotin operon repressor / biotin---[acetyl-CoA-carboxylase] ligase
MGYNYSMNADSLRAALAGKPVSQIQYFDTTDSTNEVALRWIEAGAPDGALVVADAQTAGRGRMNRRWVTQPGAALAFSLVLKPGAASGAPPFGLFSPLAAMALADALVELGVPHVEIKWPNDVLLRGRKVAGILAEAAWLGDQLQGLVLGIGVNVDPAAVPPPETLLYPATSVVGELGRPVDREDLLARLVGAVFAWRPRLGSPDFLQAWEARLAFKGRPVEVQQFDQVVSGVVLGVTEDGALRLSALDEPHQEFTIDAGDVRLRPLSF